MAAEAIPLEALVAREGPVTVERFMAEALHHPRHGYYARRDPLGARGDFTTAPEISQVFGELLGLWCVATWERMGSPSSFVLAELGPGRGTLMADALRAARVRPAFGAAAKLVLVEINETLKSAQAVALAAQAPAWCGRVQDLPAGPLLLIANEFFDALPIRQFVMTEAGWRERLIAWEGGRLAFTLRTTPTHALPAIPDAPPGGIMETNPEGERVAAAIAEHVRAHGGAALVVDYGYALAPGEPRRWEGSLQALKAHAPVNPLAQGGDADLTAHVDFFAIADAARSVGASVRGPVGQGAFLESLGIAARMQRLAKAADAKTQAELATAYHRLVAPSAMGTLFKVLAIADPTLGPLDGFA